MTKRWWVRALLAVLVMLAASAQPYFMIYKPESWSREHLLYAEGSKRFDLPVQEVENIANLPRVAEVELRGFEQIEDDNSYGVEAPDEFDGWLLLTQWSAPTHSILSGCQIWFTGSDGKTYGDMEILLSDLMRRSTAIPEEIRTTAGCTPPMQSGPRYAWDDGRLENKFPRPEEWENLFSVVMPDGVHPTKLHFGWRQPHYVTLELPDSKPFIDDLVGSS